jgi:multidrug efflux system outer membrane protein
VIRRLLLSVLPLAPLVGCDVGPDYHRPQLDTPGSFTSPGASAMAPVWPSAVWWQGFGSPELSDLIAQAEAHNLNLQSAIAAVSAADAAVRVAGGALLPTVSGR